MSESLANKEAFAQGFERPVTSTALDVQPVFSALSFPPCPTNMQLCLLQVRSSHQPTFTVDFTGDAIALPGLCGHKVGTAL